MNQKSITLKNLSAILLLFVANTISSIAQGISLIAIPWYFMQQGESDLLMKIYLSTTVIALFWGILAGAYVDKYDRKHIFLWLSVVSGVVVSTVAFIGYQWGEMPWYLAAFVFFTTFMNFNLHYPNLYAFVQEITEEKYYGRITSFLEIQGQSSSVLAGACAAILLEGTEDGVLNIIGLTIQLPFAVPKWTLTEIFTLDACTYALGFMVILLIRYTSLTKRKQEAGSIWKRLEVGYNYLKSHENITIFGIASFAIFATTLVSAFSVIAVYVKNHLHANGGIYASFDIYYALGALFAGISIQWIFRKTSSVVGVIILTFLTAGLFWVLSITTSIAIFFAMAFILGITNAGARILRTTYLFKHVPNQLYGRASSIFYITNVIFRITFLLLFLIPFFHQSNNIIYALQIFTVFLLIAAFVLIWNDRRAA